MRLSAVVLAVLSWTSPVALWAADKPGAGCDSLTGVWDYVAPSPPGRSVVAKLGTKYTFAFIQTQRQSAVEAAAPATDAEKAAAYSTAARVPLSTRAKAPTESTAGRCECSTP